MKNSLKYLIPVCIFFLFISCTHINYKKKIAKHERPNVLFIAVDDLNNMLGFLNGATGVKTPNIDRLASKGVFFSDAQCQAPLCGPSRASLMTGLRPSTTGIYGMIDDDKIRSDNPETKDIILLPEYFKQNGYHTMGIGKLFHSHSPEGLFDESGGRVEGFGPVPKKRFVWNGYGTSDKSLYGKTGTDWGAYPSADSLMPDHHSADWAINRLQRKYDKPFFLGVGFLRVHVPFYVPQKWFDLYPLTEIKTMPYDANDLNDIPQIGLRINDLPMMPSTSWAIESGEWPKIIQAYLACISFVDYEIGRILDALESTEYGDNTVIVLWSDHGYRLGEKGTFAKHGLWNTATNAPLFFSAPQLPKGKIINKPVELLSIYPTLLELCGLPGYDRNEGESLVSLMKSNGSMRPYVAITTYGMNNHAIKTEEYRFIQYEDGSEELYDQKVDPNEFVNLAGQFRYAETIRKLREYLPKKNVTWDPNSSYTFQPYFVEQKKRTSNKGD